MFRRDDEAETKPEHQGERNSERGREKEMEERWGSPNRADL